MTTELDCWDTISNREQLIAIYWDAYKSAHGIRPRHIRLDLCTEAEIEQDIDRLAAIIRDNEQQRLAAEAEAADRVERTRQTLLMSGAKDRDMAVRWLMEAHDAGNDPEYLCYLLGVDYGYFN